MTIDNFLTGDEQRALTETVGEWERSTDNGDTNELGVGGKKLSIGRTSSNSWCDEECNKHPTVKEVYRKIAEMTKIPKSYFEPFQILRYELGQKYVRHHDNGAQANERNGAGPRILTFFLYLSDVEEGGETCFSFMGICVQPKRGRALLWPSVLNSDPMVNDGRTIHEAKPVIQGRKFAANTWIHLYDHDLSSIWSCQGSGSVLNPEFEAGLIPEEELHG